MLEDEVSQITNEQVMSLLEQARQLFDKSDLVGSFLLSKEHWLSFPDDLEAVRLLCQIMRKNGKKELFVHLKTLGESRDELQNNVQSLFEAGYHFIEEREPALAAMLLSRCAQLMPENAVVSYELGFALMQLKRFSEAIVHFERSLNCDAPDFDTRLNLAVCHSLMRNLESSGSYVSELEKLAGTQEEKREILLRRWVLKRLEKFDPAHQLTVRDWLYSLYGAVLLSDTTPKDLSGKPREIAADYPGVATTLAILHGLLRELGLNFDLVEYYSPLSRPLAEALASIMDLHAAPYGGPERKETALLVMAWASDIIGPHKAFVPHSKRRTIFAYGMTSSAQLPVTPDIIGCLACKCAMPWSEELEAYQKDERPLQAGKPHPMNQIQEKAYNQILAKLADLESNPQTIRQVEDLQAYYAPRRAYLLLENADSFPERPEYTAEIPF